VQYSTPPGKAERSRSTQTKVTTLKVIILAHSEELWREAKLKCRLNAKDIALAKRLGLNPKSLIKNIPNKSQKWKAPVKDWLREIDAKRQKKADQKAQRKINAKKLETKPETTKPDATEV
jgi:hypothetical protein